MSQSFIKQQNQELLWKIINQTPQMQMYFKDAEPGAREIWFQQIIERIYYNSSPTNSIKDLNKAAIQLMLDVLQMAIEQPIKPLQQQPPLHQQQPPLHQQQHPLHQRSQASVNDLYETRLKDYDIEKKPTPQLQMTSIKDDAIVDINSAVSEYMKLRDVGIAVAPVAMTPDEPQSKPTHDEVTRTKKSVKWEDDNPLLIKILDKLQTMDNKIDILKKEIEQLSQSNINAQKPV